MKKIRILLSTLAFISAIAGAYATATLDPAVRGFVDGVCQQIRFCTIVPRTSALCPVLTDNGLYYAPTDIECIQPALTVRARVRISQ